MFFQNHFLCIYVCTIVHKYIVCIAIEKKYIMYLPNVCIKYFSHKSVRYGMHACM